MTDSDVETGSDDAPDPAIEAAGDGIADATGTNVRKLTEP